MSNNNQENLFKEFQKNRQQSQSFSNQQSKTVPLPNSSGIGIGSSINVLNNQNNNQNNAPSNTPINNVSSSSNNNNTTTGTTGTGTTKMPLRAIGSARFKSNPDLKDQNSDIWRSSKGQQISDQLWQQFKTLLSQSQSSQTQQSLSSSLQSFSSTNEINNILLEFVKHYNSQFDKWNRELGVDYVNSKVYGIKISTTPILDIQTTLYLTRQLCSYVLNLSKALTDDNLDIPDGLHLICLINILSRHPSNSSLLLQENALAHPFQAARLASYKLSSFKTSQYSSKNNSPSFLKWWPYLKVLLANCCQIATNFVQDKQNLSFNSLRFGNHSSSSSSQSSNSLLNSSSNSVNNHSTSPSSMESSFDFNQLSLSTSPSIIPSSPTTSQSPSSPPSQLNFYNTISSSSNGGVSNSFLMFNNYGNLNSGNSSTNYSNPNSSNSFSQHIFKLGIISILIDSLQFFNEFFKSSQPKDSADSFRVLIIDTLGILVSSNGGSISNHQSQQQQQQSNPLLSSTTGGQSATTASTTINSTNTTISSSTNGSNNNMGTINQNNLQSLNNKSFKDLGNEIKTIINCIGFKSYIRTNKKLTSLQQEFNFQLHVLRVIKEIILGNLNNARIFNQNKGFDRIQELILWTTQCFQPSDNYSITDESCNDFDINIPIQEYNALNLGVISSISTTSINSSSSNVYDNLNSVLNSLKYTTYTDKTSQLKLPPNLIKRSKVYQLSQLFNVLQSMTFTNVPFSKLQNNQNSSSSGSLFLSINQQYQQQQQQQCNNSSILGQSLFKRSDSLNLIEFNNNNNNNNNNNSNNNNNMIISSQVMDDSTNSDLLNNSIGDILNNSQDIIIENININNLNNINSLENLENRLINLSLNEIINQDNEIILNNNQNNHNNINNNNTSTTTNNTPHNSWSNYSSIINEINSNTIASGLSTSTSNTSLSNLTSSNNVNFDSQIIEKKFVNNLLIEIILEKVFLPIVNTIQSNITTTTTTTTTTTNNNNNVSPTNSTIPLNIDSSNNSSPSQSQQDLSSIIDKSLSSSKIFNYIKNISPELQFQIIEYLIKIVTEHNSCLTILTKYGLWNTIFSDSFYYSIPQLNEIIDSGNNEENSIQLKKRKLYLYNGIRSGCINLLQYFATLNNHDNIEEVMVILSEMKKSLIKSPSTVIELCQVLINITKSNPQRTIPSLIKLKIFQQLPQMIQILFRSETEQYQSQQKQQHQNLFKRSRNILFTYLGQLIAHEELSYHAVVEKDLIECLFFLLRKPEIKTYSITQIYFLMKLNPDNESVLSELYSTYISELSMIKEETSCTYEFKFDLILTMLDGIRQIVKNNPKKQNLFKKFGVFVKIVTLVNADDKKERLSILCHSVLRTVIILMVNNPKIKKHFRNHIGYDTIKDLIVKSEGEISETTMNILFDMIVDDEFDKEYKYIIQNSDSCLLLFNLLKYFPIKLQHKILDTFIDMVQKCTTNQSVCCNCHLIYNLLEAIYKDQPMEITTKILELIQSLGVHSVTVRELKKLFGLLKSEQGEFRPPITSALLTTLQNISNSRIAGPQVYFDFDGKDSCIILPTFDRWPFPKGFSFCTWVRIESFIDPTGTPEYRPRLFSFLSDSGCGIEVLFIYQQLQVLTVSQGQSKVVFGPQTSIALDEKTWYFVSIVYSTNLISSNEIRIYINGQQMAKAPIKLNISGTLMNHFKIGNNSKISGDRENPLYGQMGAFNIFDESLSPHQIQAIYTLGPNFNTSFQDVEGGTKNAHTFESSLTSHLFLNYNCRALDGDLCLDNTPDIGGDRNYDATLVSINPCVSRDIKDIIYCLGGIKVLFPLIQQINQPQQPSVEDNANRSLSESGLSTNNNQTLINIKLTNQVLALFKHMLKESEANQEEMLRCQGFSVMGYLLQQISPEYLTIGCINIFRDMSNQISEPALIEEIYSNLLLNFCLWIKTKFELQRNLIVVVKQIIFGEKYDQVSDIITVQLILDIMTDFYWYDEQSKEFSGGKNHHFYSKEILSKRPSASDIKDLRQILFEVLRLLLKHQRSQDIQAIVRFLVYCKDSQQLIEMMEFLLDIISSNNNTVSGSSMLNSGGVGSTSGTLSQFVFDELMSLGGCDIFLTLLKIDDEKVRMASIQLISKIHFLCSLTSNKKYKTNIFQDSIIITRCLHTFPITEITFRYLLAFTLGFNFTPQTFNTAPSLDEILTMDSTSSSSSSSSLSSSNNNRPNSGNNFDSNKHSEIKNIEILTVILKLLSNTDSIHLRQTILQELKVLINTNVSNRTSLLSIDKWSDYLFSIISDVEVKTDTQYSNVSDLIIDIMKILTLHSFFESKTGYRTLELILATLRPYGERGVLDYHQLTRTLLLNIIISIKSLAHTLIGENTNSPLIKKSKKNLVVFENLIHFFILCEDFIFYSPKDDHHLKLSNQSIRLSASQLQTSLNNSSNNNGGNDSMNNSLENNFIQINTPNSLSNPSSQINTGTTNTPQTPLSTNQSPILQSASSNNNNNNNNNTIANLLSNSFNLNGNHHQGFSKLHFNSQDKEWEDSLLVKEILEVIDTLKLYKVFDTSNDSVFSTSNIQPVGKTSSNLMFSTHHHRIFLRFTLEAIKDCNRSDSLNVLISHMMRLKMLCEKDLHSKPDDSIPNYRCIFVLSHLNKALKNTIDLNLQSHQKTLVPFMKDIIRKLKNLIIENLSLKHISQQQLQQQLQQFQLQQSNSNNGSGHNSLSNSLTNVPNSLANSINNINNSLATSILGSINNNSNNNSGSGQYSNLSISIPSSSSLNTQQQPSSPLSLQDENEISSWVADLTDSSRIVEFCLVVVSSPRWSQLVQYIESQTQFLIEEKLLYQSVEKRKKKSNKQVLNLDEKEADFFNTTERKADLDLNSIQVKLWSPEVERRSLYLTKAKEQRNETTVQWRKILRSLTNERGPWGTTESIVHWKLDKTENSSRMRLKLKRNYKFDEHMNCAINDSEFPDDDQILAKSSSSNGTTDNDNSKQLSDSNSLNLLLKPKTSGDQEVESDWTILPKDNEQDQSNQSNNGEVNIDTLILQQQIQQHQQQKEKEKLIYSTSCQWITPSSVKKGKLDVTTLNLIFTEEEENNSNPVGFIGPNEIPKFKRWPNEMIKEIHLRRYLLRGSAIEIFMRDKTNYFFNFKKNERNKIFSKLNSVRREFSKEPTLSPSDMLKKATAEWQSRRISNFDYLITLNTIAGRTYNDLTQYPVFPWIIADYTSNELDLSKPETFRDLSKPIGALNEKRLEIFRERYEYFDDPVIPKFFYGSHYSSAGIVLFYLIRLEPFTTQFLNLQGGRFDHADRMFDSISLAWENTLSSSTDVKELIPEFFYMPEFLTNHNDFNFGKKQNGIAIGDVQLPPWASSPLDFVRLNREALESDYVSMHLHEWIDLIFGIKQRGKLAEEVFNVFYYLTYEGSVDIDAIEDETTRKATESQINNFGQTPTQLFPKKYHPQRDPLNESHISILKTPPNQLQAYFLKITNKNPIVYVFIPDPNPIMSYLVADKVTVIDKSRTTTNHKWFPNTPNDKISPFTFELDPSSTTKRRIGLPFANDVTISPNCFAITSDGRYVISCCHWDNSFKLSYVDSAKLIQSVVKHKDTVTCLSLASDGQTLITGSKDTTVMVWKISTNKGVPKFDDVPEHILYGHDDEITCVDVNVGLDISISGSKDGTCIIHNLKHGEYVRSIYLPKQTPISLIAISNQGYIIIYSQADLTMYLYSINGQLLKTVDTHERLHSIILSKDSEYLLTGGEKGVVVIRTLYNLKPTPHKLVFGTSIHSLAMASDQKHLMVGLNDGRLLIVAQSTGSN